MNNEHNNEQSIKRYVIANIKIPIEIKEDGSIVPQKDCIDIEFSNCQELPKKQDCEVNYSFAMNKLSVFLQEEDGDEDEDEDEEKEQEEPIFMTILKEDIKPRTNAPKINTSFKQNTQYKHRHTIKHHSA